ncbi:hypothetical protein TYRP_007160 [Tyrophagus putrescentiae]|nr:hypothetical protein TYRP_007160 [Tyrophagus putrescentiae]
MAANDDDFADHALAEIIKVFPADKKLLIRSNGAYMRDAVELLFSNSKTIVMYKGDEFHKRDLFGRFFRVPESECEVIKKNTQLRPINRNLNERVNDDAYCFYSSVFRLFPNTETLVLDIKIDDCQALALAGRLHSMERLKTFGIFRGDNLSEMAKRMLAVSVNHSNIENIGFYELGRSFFSRINFANFNRVSYESVPGKRCVKDIFRYLSTRNSSFWARGYTINAKHIEQLATINRPVVENLRKLALCNIDQGNRSVLELQKLKNEFFASLVHLASLKTLELSNFQVDSNMFPALPGLHNLTQLKFLRFCPTTRLNEQIMPVDFSEHISSLFLNIDQLTLKTFDAALALYASAHIANHFESLKAHEFKRSFPVQIKENEQKQ